MNYLAILVSALATMALGFVWYSALFKKPWMKLMGYSASDMDGMKKGMGKTYGLSLVATLVMAFVLARFVAFANAQTLMDGALIGFWAWLGFVATTMLNNVLFGKEKTSLFYINTGYQLASLAIMGAILAVWV